MPLWLGGGVEGKGSCWGHYRAPKLGFAIKVYRARPERWEAVSLMVPPTSRLRDPASGAPGKGASLPGWVTGGEGQSLEGCPRDCSQEIRGRVLCTMSLAPKCGLCAHM